MTHMRHVDVCRANRGDFNCLPTSYGVVSGEIRSPGATPIEAAPASDTYPGPDAGPAAKTYPTMAEHMRAFSGRVHEIDGAQLWALQRIQVALQYDEDPAAIGRVVREIFEALDTVLTERA